MTGPGPRYRASAFTPDGVIVYSTDDPDELVGIARRHSAAGNTLVLTDREEQAAA